MPADTRAATRRAIFTHRVRLRGTLKSFAPLLCALALSLSPAFFPEGVALRAVARAQDEKPRPPPIMPDEPLSAKIVWEQVRHLVEHTIPGKVALGLLVLLTLVRIRAVMKSHAQRAGATGEGFFGGHYSRKQLETLMKNGEFDQAGELVLKLGAKGGGPPGDVSRELEAAELFLKARRYARAAEIFVRKGRGKRAAEAYERAQSWDLAAELYEKAQELPKAEEMYLKAGNKPAIARMWQAAGNSAKAAVYFSEISRPKEAGDELEKIGKKPEALKKYIEAYSLLTQGAKVRGGERDLGVEKESGEIFAKICKLFEELKDYGPYAEFLVKNDRQDAAAEVYRKAGDLAKAAELLRSARHFDAAGRLLEEMGDHHSALLAFASGRMERGEVDKAAALYMEAGEHLMAAENYEKVGKIDKAAEIYEKSHDHARAADLYAKASKYDKAAALYEAAKQWDAAVFCWEQSGGPAKVAACWERAGNHFAAGVSYFTAREVAHAIASLEKVPKDHADRKEAARLLGILLHEAKRDKEAMGFFDEGFGRRIENDDVEAFYYCAQTLETLPEQRAKAISAYETIQKLRPGFRDTDRRLAALRAGSPLPKTSIYQDGKDDPGSLFHTSRRRAHGRPRPPAPPREV